MTELQHTIGKISRQVGRMLTANCMALSVISSNSDGFFPVGTSEGACLWSPSQDYRRTCGKTASSCDNDQCQHIKACSRECCVVHCCLPWDGCSPLQTLTVTMWRPWFGHLIACTTWRWSVSWKLVTGHTLNNIFGLFFFTMYHTKDSLCTNFIPPCT